MPAPAKPEGRAIFRRGDICSCKNAKFFKWTCMTLLGTMHRSAIVRKGSNNCFPLISLDSKLFDNNTSRRVTVFKKTFIPHFPASKHMEFHIEGHLSLSRSTDIEVFEATSWL
ncbi:hypothetical protein CEXT_364891 [Caerostris extrusa]|nr:hypothetical protein CEXT_364891 [Caerostris extrusa]